MKLMARLPLWLALCASWLTLNAADTRSFELRIYHAAPGKLGELQARFRDHTHQLFLKHGMTPLGYWVPLEEKEGATNTLYYVLAYPSREARERSWKAFSDDPVWQKVRTNSEANGRLVERAEEKFLQATDYSPEIKPDRAAEPRTFELRTYTAAPGRLGALNARFRDHTLALFAKHGITNVAYWNPAPGQPGADDTLIYLLAHRNREAADASFKAFGQDSDWKQALKDSETKAGGPLTVQGGVKRLFLTPTDYSPMR